MANFSFCLTLVFLLLCGGFPLGADAARTDLTASGSTQYFASRNYPFNYLHNTNDQWVIDSGSSSYRIRVFVDDSSIEPESYCNFDYFQFIDGSLSGPASARYCGSWSSCYFESSGRYATITFTTDPTIANKGFKMGFYQVSGTRATGVTTCTSSTSSLGYAVGYRRSGAPPTVSVPAAWRVVCTAVVCLLCSLVGWGGCNV